MLFRVFGKFADRHSFSIPMLDAAGPREAIASAVEDAEIRAHASPIVMIAAKALTGARRRVRISDTPAKERKRKPKDATPAKKK